MLFRTEVKVCKADFEIRAAERMLFVGSCFADNLGKRFAENKFPTTANPYGVMYNPASILHTVERLSPQEHFGVAVLTMGTNHVYVLKETGEIVDNCQKRPQCLFREQELSAEACLGYIEQSIRLLQARNHKTRIILTVSPIRYAKYGYPGSMLSKATLLVAVHEAARRNPGCTTYFPAYEILNDELRDYRFYKEDMLHPSDQAVEYIWQKFRETYFGQEAEQFLAEWKPIKEALAHRPFCPDSEEYQRFLHQTKEKEQKFYEKYLKAYDNDIHD